MPCAGGNLHADAQARQCQAARRSTSAATYPPENFEDHGSCEVAATPLRPPSGRRGMYCRRFCSYAICFTNISCIFAPKELKRGLEGGISLSTKSRHLPLRKQFHHDSSGNYTSSLNETALLFLRNFYSSNTVLHL